ncbi:MAG: hypothetical protein QOE36_2548 [Gaiellaceae bacterium]|jgi:hypothetical protein|nr:hypothetical protein [Gaiellaceae bacterium]
MWSHLRSGLVGGVVAGAVILAGSAVAGNGIGDVFNLGQPNTVNASSSLTGTTAGKQLDVQNLSTAASSSALYALGKGSVPTATFQNGGAGPAVSLLAGKGQPPFTTNSAYKVVSLNADKLDGVDSTELLHGNGASYSARKELLAPNVGDQSSDTMLTIPGLGTITGSCNRSSATLAVGAISITPVAGGLVTTGGPGYEVQEGTGYGAGSSSLFMLDFVIARGTGTNADAARGTAVVSPNPNQGLCRITVTATRTHA